MSVPRRKHVHIGYNEVYHIAKYTDVTNLTMTDRTYASYMDDRMDRMIQKHRNKIKLPTQCKNVYEFIYVVLYRILSRRFEPILHMFDNVFAYSPSMYRKYTSYKLTKSTERFDGGRLILYLCSMYMDDDDLVTLMSKIMDTHIYPVIITVRINMILFRLRSRYNTNDSVTISKMCEHMDVSRNEWSKRKELSSLGDPSVILSLALFKKEVSMLMDTIKSKYDSYALKLDQISKDIQRILRRGIGKRDPYAVYGPVFVDTFYGYCYSVYKKTEAYPYMGDGSSGDSILSKIRSCLAMFMMARMIEAGYRYEVVSSRMGDCSDDEHRMMRMWFNANKNLHIIGALKRISPTLTDGLHIDLHRNNISPEQMTMINNKLGKVVFRYTLNSIPAMHVEEVYEFVDKYVQTPEQASMMVSDNTNRDLATRKNILYPVIYRLIDKYGHECMVQSIEMFISYYFNTLDVGRRPHPSDKAFIVKLSSIYDINWVAVVFQNWTTRPDMRRINANTIIANITDYIVTNAEHFRSLMSE